MILPAVDDVDTAPFWTAAGQGRLVIQRCTACSRWRFPPAVRCPHCRSNESEWSAVSGDATVWSFVVAHGPTLPGYAEETPFPIAVVELAEGTHLRMVGNVVPAADARLGSITAEDIAIGDPVRVAFREIGPNVVIPVWVPDACRGADAALPSRKNGGDDAIVRFE